MRTILSFLLFVYCFTPQVNTDLNHDGHLSCSDIVMFRLEMGQVDANMNGIINEDDVLFLRHYLAFRSYRKEPITHGKFN